jgi:hypothetical protein
MPFPAFSCHFLLSDKERKIGIVSLIYPPGCTLGRFFSPQKLNNTQFTLVYSTSETKTIHTRPRYQAGHALFTKQESIRMFV